MALIIGLTGGIASGKSTVAKMLLELGIPVIDADQIAREVVEVGEEAYLQIVKEFGEEILQEDRTIDRGKLGSIVFHDKEKRQRLNSIVHPAVRKKMLMQKDQYIRSGENAIVLDIPLLFESNLTHLVDKIIVVYVDEHIQLQRLMARNGLSKEEAEARMKAQMPLIEKVSKADAVINNNGTIEETKQQLLNILAYWDVL
ncbi:dephospho-CoA kinase [Bacillus alveayuensis]|uniref:dephospho-CoA kinase n=1 Tax=Aeribacillus alveayuensis TaxID=279215 RepID=UPI0005D0F6FF|nr:dephospho-CoA kinase [Bacillus alveayuensis]